MDNIIAWQESGRIEYEIGVCDAFEDDSSRLEKWDCYMQVKPNMEMLAHEIIRQYKEQKEKIE